MSRLQEWLSILDGFWQEHHLLRALSLIAAAIIVARLVEWLLLGVVARWASRSRTDFDDRMIRLLHRPVFTSVLLGGLWITTQALALQPNLERVTLRILATLFILTWLVSGTRIVALVIRAAGDNERVQIIDRHTRPLFDNLLKIVLFAAAAYLLLIAWDINPTGWLASAGIAGIAIGFAAKDTLANLFSGVFIFADSPYKIGDFINLDSGERGQVTDIGLRSTRIMTRDDVEITIPNAVIAGAKIINESGGPSPKYRVRVKVGVAYGSDIDQVRKVLLEIAIAHPDVCAEPSPRVRFRSFGDSALEHELLCWIDQPVLRGRVLDALNCEVYRRFKTEGIEIPYSKHDIYIKEMPAPPLAE